MEAFEIKSTKDKLIITIDRSSVDAKFLTSFLKRLKDENQAAKTRIAKTRAQKTFTPKN